VESKSVGNKNDFFDIRRFFQLCQLYLGKDVKELFSLWCKIIFIFVTLAFILGMMRPYGSMQLNHSLFHLILKICIIYKALSAFAEYREKESSISWMMTPGSSFEKFLSRLLITSLGLLVTFTFLFFIGINLGHGILSVIYDRSFLLFIPFSHFGTSSEIIFLLNLHAVFFAGGILYKRHPFIKTCLTIAVIILFILIIIVTFGSGMVSFAISHYQHFNININGKNCPIFIGQLFTILFHWTIPIICWLITYYKIRGKEIV
jgi:hypothetical protein